ncbi:ExeM/NucH family extracellular endonuclease, partial [Nocardioides zhouii]|uniref:ExeM/NucH family extracellular endonuclease n=1 Tax=Nocardioides zhouii TaxID=1168729 RepID=UPI0013EDA43F
MRSRTRRAPRAALHLTTLLALVASPLALGFTAPAAAASSGVVITEVFGGNGATNLYNQDFVELTNTSASAVDVTGWSVQYRAAASTSGASSKIDLVGKIPAGGTLLAGGQASTCTPACTNTIPTPDASNGSMNLSGTAGVVILSNEATLLTNAVIGAGSVVNHPKIVDLVGYGSTANVFENAATAATAPAPAPSNTTTLKRTATDADDNSAEFAASAPGTPLNCDCFAPAALKVTEVYTDGGLTGSAYDHDFVELQNTSGSTLPMTGLTLQYRAPGATGPATVVATLSGSMAASSFDVVQLAGTDGNGAALPTPEYTAALDLSAAGGTLFVAKSATPIDPGTGAVAVDQFRGDLVGWGTAGAFETTAADATDLGPILSIQRANGGVDSGDNSADFASYAPSPNAQPAIPVKTIPEIQGTGPATTLANANVSTSGVVTAAYANGADNFSGFYLQTAGYDPAADATPGSSDGIFVFTGSSATFPTPTVGQHVTLSSAKVSEFRGMTELTVTNPANLTVRAATLAEGVKAGTVLPGSDCALPGTNCLTGATLEAAREAHEGELFLPVAPYTVTDSYDGSPWDQGPSEGFKMKGEIGLAANSTEPLIAPTEVANPTREPAAHAARIVWNEAHRVTLDDGHNADYTTSANRGIAMPWLTATHTVRVGAAVTFVQPVVFDYRDNLWKLQPQSKVTDDGESKVSIEQDRPAAPADVLKGTGNLKIATFNMLNYFVHTSQAWDALPDDATGALRTCTDNNTDRAGALTTAGNCSWTDRRTEPDTANSPGPRGAATPAAFKRQEDKELESINKIDADVLSLEEVENAIKIGDYDRDAALQQLVPALNAHWAAAHPGEDPALGDRWAYVASPRLAAQATILEQDAIRPAFIYNPRTVETVGRSQMLVNSAPFRNAREPLAQGFKRVGGNRDDGFIVIANHFKSKSPAGATGDNVDKGDGAGSYNGDRTRQAKALDAFADGLAADLDIPAVFLTGDLNAYSHEDPIEALRDTGWHTLESDNGEKSYSFGGFSGSLDHALANDAALAMVTGSTVWTINANEPVFYEYSRHNFNFTDLYAVNPFRSSDHNPEIIGVNAPKNPPVADLDTVQVLASNDFHGRLLDDPASASAGAAAMATAVKGLRDPVTGNPNTVFAMAGDIVGASTFESFIQNDKPTIDAMNEAGLEVSAAGNHEFDQGYDDLMNRIMSATDAEGGTAWPYIAANVREAGDLDAYALETDREDGNFAHSNGATWWKQFDGLNDGAGIRVGFVGAVTEDLESLVAPGNLDGLAITSIVDEVNDAATVLKTDGCGGEPCDLVVELVHEGAPSPSCDVIKDDEDSTFGRIVHGASDDVDAIVSGHTHLKYNCKVEVTGKTFSDGKQYKRPVVSAGQYGSYLNQLQFDFAPDTADLVGIRQHVLAMKDFDDDADTKAIVDAAVSVAAVKGAVELGEVMGPFKRARRTDPSGIVENRGGESTLGNLVAEIQREATGAEIGVMNPGGLRDDLIGTGNGPGPVTYREAANVQPFANTLVTTELTGAQLKLLLEQQWQRDPDNNVPSRPFLRLGTSKGFTWTEDSSRAEGSRITGMWLDGTAVDAGETYTVAANSFVASGGDNFRALTLGTDKRDTGVTDLQATVDYLEAHPSLAVDYRQHAVGARVPNGPYAAGDTVTFDVNSLSMTGEGDVTDAAMAISIGARDLGSFAVTTNLPATPYDIPGAGTVSFVLPSGLSGTQLVTLTGGSTGTVATVPIQVTDTRADSTVSGTAADITWGEAGSVDVTTTGGTDGVKVELYDGATKIGEGTLTGGATTIAIPAKALPVGAHTLTLKYVGDDATKPSQGSVQVTVVKATSAVSGTAADITWGDAGSVSVTVDPSEATGTVELYDGATKLGDTTVTQGSITIAAKALAVGTHSLTLKYLGDGNHAADEGTVSVTVVKASSTVSGTAADITWGDAGSVTVTVAPAAATGTVELYDGATKLGDTTVTQGSITIAAKALAV